MLRSKNFTRWAPIPKPNPQPEPEPPFEQSFSQARSNGLIRIRRHGTAIYLWKPQWQSKPSGYTMDCSTAVQHPGRLPICINPEHRVDVFLAR
jgi:hypothetical protein